MKTGNELKLHEINQIKPTHAETDTSDEEYEYQSYGGHHNYKYTLGCDEMDDLIPDLCSFC